MTFEAYLHILCTSIIGMTAWALSEATNFFFKPSEDLFGVSLARLPTTVMRAWGRVSQATAEPLFPALCQTFPQEMFCDAGKFGAVFHK